MKNIWNKLFGIVMKTTEKMNKKEDNKMKLNRDEKLSENFKLGEFLKSQTASRKNIDNTPGGRELNNIRKLVKHLLQPIRTDLDSSVIITSGYRCPELNDEIGGSDSSQHMSGEAADIESTLLSTYELSKFIRDNYNFDQLILEFFNPEEGINSGWVHVSYVSEEENRNEVLTALKTSSGVSYHYGLITEEP